ncbi:MAG: ion transporter, partial [Cyanobacteria bacterium J06649_11]
KIEYLQNKLKKKASLQPLRLGKVINDIYRIFYFKIASSMGPWYVLYFMIVIFFGSFYLINLVLAVVAVSYQQETAQNADLVSLAFIQKVYMLFLINMKQLKM